MRQGRTDHVAHGVTLETELLGEIEKDVLYLFHGDWYLLVGSPSGVGICALSRVGEGRAKRLADLRADGRCIGAGTMARIRRGIWWGVGEG